MAAMIAAIRVYELAKELSVDSRRVLAVLTELGMHARTASSSLSPSEAAAVRATIDSTTVAPESAQPSAAHQPTPNPPPGALPSEEDLRRLVREAFELARQSGRSDWRRMTAAVLKNRLLQLTDRSFSERDYGCKSMLDLARRLPDLLVIDEGDRPPIVTLVTTDASTAPPIIGEGSRIRPDLWTAIVDYQSGSRYYWDGFLARREDELDEDLRTSSLPVATANKDDLDEWRYHFVASNSVTIDEDPEAKAKVERWLAEGLGTKYLPGTLQGRWNVELKRRVVERLMNWFHEVSQPAPLDLLQPTRTGHGSKTSSPRPDELRQLILRCVRGMTEEELGRLLLPATAVLRMNP